MIKQLISASLGALALFALPAQAVKLEQGDYRYREDVEQFIEKLAKTSDYSEQQLIDLFSQVKNQRQLFERMNKPAEKLEWHQYRKIFLTDKRIKSGIKFWKEHQALLKQVEQKYQVPAEIVVAIVGVETFYGAYKGKAPVFDTLVTFAFDYPKRARFFTAELEQFLRLSAAQKFDVRSIKGSYAGAMGMPQFIASSYRNYAVDFDGDGVANLFDNKQDVLGSVANYFKRHGWQPGQAIAFPLSLKKSGASKIKQFKPGVKPTYAWKELRGAGVDTSAKLDDDSKVALIKLQQKKGPEYWVGLKNFYVITRYNHSELYAMAVYQLSQKIKQGMSL
jgi:membrane-bound lytic murein transglycosylase B